MLSRKLLELTVVVVVLTGMPQQIGACVCPMRPPVAKAAQAADVIVRGTVIDMIDTSNTPACQAAAEGVPPPPDEFTAYCGLAVTIRIDALWKGPRKLNVTVVTGHGGGDCGAEFAKAGRYVVFARKLKAGALYTDGCTYTGEAGGSTEAIKSLGAPLWEPSA